MRQLNIATIMTLLILLTSTAYAQTGTVAVKVTQIDVKEGGKIKIGIYASTKLKLVFTLLEDFHFLVKKLMGLTLKSREHQPHTFSKIFLLVNMLYPFFKIAMLMVYLIKICLVSQKNHTVSQTINTESSGHLILKMFLSM